MAADIQQHVWKLYIVLPILYIVLIEKMISVQIAWDVWLHMPL